ncbi:MAG: shikimate dehydrogenase [Muribaculaceae bacterium]|nr:shikimate dehydrogenase [Muribaculaceae bacterium]
MLPKHPDRLYGLIGYPLGHSFSQNYFNQKFDAEGISARYVNFEIPDIGDIMEVVAENPNLGGLNVTIPYKEQVIPYLDELDPDAAAIGAVNVIKFIRDRGRLKFKGYNSDVIGFSDSIRPMLTPARDKALILGTGGAAKAVAHGLRSMGVEPVYVSRTPRPGILAYSELTAEVMASHKIIVNTTPLGMYPHVDEAPDIPYEYLTPEHLCYDLLYNPDVTMFMKRSGRYGAEVKNGLEMLLLQAFVSWNIWNSKY